MSLSGDQVRATTFATTKFREGYDQEQVDELLERAARSLDASVAGEPPELTPEAVLNARFAATKYREGYDQDEVDDFLDRVVTSLRATAPPPPPLDAAAARRLLSELPLRRFGPGYEPAPVAGLVEKVAVELDRRRRDFRPSLTADEVAATRLTATWWRPGYDRSAVDALLERAASTLRTDAPDTPRD